MAQQHLPPGTGHLSERLAAALGDDLFSQVFEADDPKAGKALYAGAQRIKALVCESGLRRHEEVDRRPQRVIPQVPNDPLLDQMALARPSPPEDELHVARHLQSGKLPNFGRLAKS